MYTEYPTARFAEDEMTIRMRMCDGATVDMIIVVNTGRFDPYTFRSMRRESQGRRLLHQSIVRMPITGWIVCALAWIAILAINVESVLFTGPVILMVGGLGVIGSLWIGHVMGAVCGVGYAGIAVLMFILVRLQNWSPMEAHTPFVIIGLAFIAGWSPLVCCAWQTRPAPRPLWQCARCGYALIGLASSRCPECGHSFDTEAVRAATEAARS